jgi:hypothetical protein
MREIQGALSQGFDTLQLAVNRLVADLTGEPMGSFGPGTSEAVDRFYETMSADFFERLPELLEHQKREWEKH